MSPAMVIDIGITAPAPRPCSARNAISVGMLQARPHSTLPARNRPIPISMIGLRPNVSESFAYTDTDTAWASRYTENSQGNSANPPTSRTIVGTAVARTVVSIAMRPVATMMASSTGPRSERSPTAARAVGPTTYCKSRQLLSIPMVRGFRTRPDSSGGAGEPDDLGQQPVDLADDRELRPGVLLGGRALGRLPVLVQCRLDGRGQRLGQRAAVVGLRDQHPDLRDDEVARAAR